MTTVPSKKLNNGTEIPEIGLGVFLMPGPKTAEIVYQALKVGYRHFDSAVVYKNEEEVCQGIAKWLKEDPEHNKRADVYYTTKLWDPAHGYERAQKAIQVCLEKAKSIGYIDLLLVHSARSDWKRRHGTWKAMEEAVESGNVKSIGLSNYALKHVQELLDYKDLKIVPAVDQVELHPWMQRKELVSFLKEKGIGAEAYSPLTRGMWLDDPALVKVAKKHGKSTAQVLINWSLSKGFITLPKTENPARLVPNLEVYDFKLDAEDLAAIEHDGDTPTWKDSTLYPLDSEKTEEQLAADRKRDEEEEAEKAEKE